jgi:pimeloyl-ACP methyl ester carboxylesterase
MAAFHRAYVPGRWGQIHLRIAPGSADATPLLMLHQTPKNGWLWEPILPLLCQGRTLIAPDTPGYGGSDRPEQPVEIADFAAEMLSLMDRLEAEGVAPGGRFDVMGYHTGSALAAALGRLAPDRVRKIVMISMPVFTADERAKLATYFPDEPKLEADGSHLTKMWKGLEGLTDPRASLVWRQQSLTANLVAGTGAYRGFAALYRYDMADDLTTLRQEDLLIVNPEDDLWNETHRAAESLPGARMIELRDTQHGLFAIMPERIAEIASAFLAG